MPELTPEQKAQLDRNIRNLIEQGADEEDVMAYARDFKAKYDVAPVEKKNLGGAGGQLAGVSQRDIAGVQQGGLSVSQAKQPEPVREVSANPYDFALNIINKAKPNEPELRSQLYDQIVGDVESGDEARIGKARDELSALSKESDPRVITPSERSELFNLTGVEDPAEQLEVINARLNGSVLNPLVNVDLATLPAADSEKLGKLRDKLSVTTSKKNTTWSNKDVLTKGGENVSEFDKIRDMMSGLAGVQNAAVEEAKRYNAEKLNDSFSTGLESIKNTDRARYDRVADAIRSGKPLATNDVVDLTAAGSKILETLNAQDIVDRKITSEQFEDEQLKLSQDQQNNVYGHPDFLRTLVADVIAKHYEKEGGVVFSKWMVTDKEIDAVPESEFAAQGLDVNNPEFKKQLEHLKSKEGWFPFQNSIAKDDLLREFRKGFAEPIKGIVSTVESVAADIADTEEDLVLDQRTKGFGLAEGANQRGEYFDKKYGKYADAFSGFGQFASQLALMAAGEGAVAAAGGAIGGGTTAARLMGATRLEKLGNLLVDNAGLYSTYGTSFAQSYGDYFKDALAKGANPLHAKMMAMTNASIEGASEVMFDNLAFGKQLAKDFMNKRNFDRIAKVFDRGVWDELAEKQFREVMVDGTKAFLHGAGKGAGVALKSAAGLAKEAFEEVPVAITNFVVDAANNPQNVKGKSVLLEAKDAFMNGLVSFSIPALLGFAGSYKQMIVSSQQSPAETLMISAMQRPYVAESIDRLLKQGKITQQEANQKHQVINTAAKELNNLVGLEYADGGTVSWEDRENYLQLSVRQRILEEKIKNSDDEAANAVTQKQLADTIEQKKEILGVNKKPEAATAATAPAVQVERTAAEKLQIQADEINMAANELAPEQMEEKKAMWKQANDLRQQAVELELAEKDKVAEVTTPEVTNDNTLAERVRSVLSVPKSEAESEVKMAEGFKNSSDEDVMQYATDQAIDAPESLLSALGGDRELTTDLIAEKSAEEIEQAKTKWRQKIKDLADDAPDETIMTVRGNVKRAVALLDEGLAKKAEPKKEPAKEKVRVTAEQLKAAQPAKKLTDEAKAILEKLDKDGATPTFISKNLERIATEHGIEVTNKTKAQDIIKELREIRGDKPKPKPAKQAKIDLGDDLAEDHNKKGKTEFGKLKSDIDEVNKKIDEATDGNEAAKLFEQRNELYKQLRANLGNIEDASDKVKATSNLLDIAQEHGVSIEDAAEIDKIAETSKTREEFDQRYNEFISKTNRLSVGQGGLPQVTNFSLGRSDRKGEGFEDVLATTDQFAQGDLTQYNRPMKRNIGTSMNVMNREGNVSWFNTDGAESKVLGLEMFHDPNGKKLTGNESLYEIMTGNGYSDRQRGMAVAYVIAQRLSGAEVSKNNTLHDFNTRLFEKVGGTVQLMYRDSEAAPLIAATSKGSVVINAHKLGERLADYVRLGGGERSMLTWAEVALNEEMLHLATFKAATKADLEKVYDEMSEEERNLVTHIYQQDLSKMAVAGEYLRMVLQERVLGRISSQNGTVNTRGTITEMFRPGANLSKQEGQPAPNQKTSVRNFFAKLTAYLKSVFKGTKSEKAKEIIQKVEDFIAGKPLKGAPQIKEAVVKNDPSVFAIEYGGRDNLIQFREDENGGGYYRVVREADGTLRDVVDPIRGSSLIGRNVGEAQDAIVMTTEMLGASIGQLKNRLRKSASIINDLKTIRDFVKVFESDDLSDALEDIQKATPETPVKKNLFQKVASLFSKKQKVKPIGDQEFADTYLSSFMNLIKNNAEQIPLEESEGRVSFMTLYDSNDKVLVKAGDTINKRNGQILHNAGFDEIMVANDGLNMDRELTVDELFEIKADIGDILQGEFMLGASEGRGISKNAAGILNKINDEKIGEIIDAYNAMLRIPNTMEGIPDSMKVSAKNAIRNAGKQHSIMPLVQEFGQSFIENAVTLQAITADEGEILNNELENINSDDISGLGFMLNAAQGKNKGQQLWERKQQEKLEREAEKAAKDVKSGKISYDDAIKNKSDEFAQALAAKVNPTVADDTFRGTVDRLRDSNYSKAEVINDLSTIRPLSKQELDIIDDVYANSYENDPDVQALREQLTDLQAGRRPKSVAARLLQSKVSRIAKLLKEFAYDKTSNKELEAMADHVLQGVDQKDLEKLIDSMNSIGLADIKNILRAKAISILDKSVQPGSRAMATRITQEWANESTVQGRAIQSNRRAYEILGANSPRFKSVFARQFLDAVKKTAEDRVRQVVDNYEDYIKETERLNDELHQEAIDKILESELWNNKLQEELDKICKKRTKGKR